METSTFGGANPFLGYFFLAAAAYFLLLLSVLCTCRAFQESENWLLARSIADYDISKSDSKAQLRVQFARLSYY